MLVESGFYSKKAAMEDIAVKDVTQMEEDIFMDRLAENKIQIRMKNEQYQADLQFREELKQSLIPELLQDPEFLQLVSQLLQGGEDGEEPAAGPPPPPDQGPGAVTGRVDGQNPDAGQPDLGIPSESAPPEGGAVGAIPAEFSPQAIQELRPGSNEPAFS
jgi:hypothetical protein